MFEKLVSFTKKVADLPDRPSLNPSALKAQFDAAPDEVREYLNKLIDALKSTVSGDSGAKNIGATTITGLTGNDVQSLLESLKKNMDELTKNIPHLHIELANDFALSSGGDAIIPNGNFGLTTNNGGWVNLTDRWEVPFSGVYNISLFGAVGTTANGVEVKFSVYVYGNNNVLKKSYIVGDDNSTNGKWVYTGSSMNVYLAQGDRIAVIAYQNSGVNQNVKQARLTAVLVGKY